MIRSSAMMVDDPPSAGGSSFRIAVATSKIDPPANGGAPCDHLVEHHAEREQVAAQVDRVPLELLRRHIARRADDQARLRQGARNRAAPGSARAMPKSSSLTP